jgi:transcriptional regulator with XRE-family HTH domain
VKSPVFTGTGERVAQARRSAGLSRREVAEPLGLRLWDIEQIESGRAEPGDDLLKRIADVLGCSPLWLRSGAALVQFDEKRDAELAEREKQLELRERQLDVREEELRRREEAAAQREAAVAVAAATAEPAPVSAGWNVDTLAHLVATHGARYPERIVEWQATLQALRSVAGADGALTPQLEGLARDVFAPLLRGAA